MKMMKWVSEEGRVNVVHLMQLGLRRFGNRGEGAVSVEDTVVRVGVAKGMLCLCLTCGNGIVDWCHRPIAT